MPDYDPNGAMVKRVVLTRARRADTGMLLDPAKQQAHDPTVKLDYLGADGWTSAREEATPIEYRVGLTTSDALRMRQVVAACYGGAAGDVRAQEELNELRASCELRALAALSEGLPAGSPPPTAEQVGAWLDSDRDPMTLALVENLRWRQRAETIAWWTVFVTQAPARWRRLDVVEVTALEIDAIALALRGVREDDDRGKGQSSPR